MKKLMYVLSVLFFISCGTNTTDNTTTDDNQTKDETVTEKDESKAGDGSCEEFLADYEVWVNEMIVVIKKAKANPLDIQNTKKMMEATSKMAEWTEKWTALYDCANNEKYTKKMEELQEKVEKEIGE